MGSSGTKPCVIVDTREKRPLDFDAAKVDSMRGTLPTGDYSVQGLESKVCIERKSLEDLVNTVVHDRPRFERELERMRSFDFKAVLIEASLADVRDHRYRSQASPASIFGSVMCMHVDYGVPFIWCHDRAIAGRVCERLLRRYYERQQEKQLDSDGADLP